MKNTMNNHPESEKKDKITGKSEFWEYVRIVVAVVLVVGIVNTFFLLNARIPSDSMENTIMEGDQLFTEPGIPSDLISSFSVFRMMKASCLSNGSLAFREKR